MTQLSQTPVLPSNRVAIVDVLRGYALLGVAIINYTSFRDWDYTHGSSLDSSLGFIANYIFFHKSALLLSVLFGYGFAVLIARLQRNDENAVIFFLKRMFWLFVIAFVNSCFFDGDILKSYAALGVMLLLFYRASTKTVLVWAVVLTCLIPLSSGYTLYGMSSHVLDWAQSQRSLFLSHNPIAVVKYNLLHSYVVQSTWPFYVISVQHIMLCCFLWGMFAYRIRFAENLLANKKKIKLLFWLSIPAFAISTVITEVAKHEPLLLTYCNFFIIPYLCAMISFTAGIMWLYAEGKMKSVFTSMQYYGRMTLTNYLVQNLIAFFVFSGVGLSIGNSKPYWFYFAFAVIVYGVQIFISRYWLKNHNYGPVEWLWRRLGSRKTSVKRKLTLAAVAVKETNE